MVIWAYIAGKREGKGLDKGEGVVKGSFRECGKYSENFCIMNCQGTDKLNLVLV